MYVAFPRSDYYEDSVPPQVLSQRRACPPTPRLGAGKGNLRRFPRSLPADRRGRHPAIPLQPRHEYAAAFPHGLPTCFILRLRSRRTPQRPACTADRPISTRLESAPRLRGFHHWFLHSYTFPSRLPSPTRLAVPDRLVVVRAAPTLPCVFRIRLPSASPVCCDRPEVGLHLPPGQVAPRGAR